jgi:aminoglycoside phosphotransferase family enzyme/predicted kinase
MDVPSGGLLLLEEYFQNRPAVLIGIKRAQLCRGDDGWVDPLIAALRDPGCYPHPVEKVEIVETHISWVLLAGEYAYKLKKPVRLPFLDFSTLQARRHYCEEELRLNLRTAPELYLDVLPIVKTAGGLSFVGAGAPLDYAVRMRRFPADALADWMARAGRLGPAQIDAIAQAVVRFHATLPAAAAPAGFGTAARVSAPALGNFDQLAALPAAAGSRAELARLHAWTAQECGRLAPVFDARHAAGFVRECHGDLHLGNIAFVDGRAVPFDGIEFDPGLRWIDVMSEVAFLVMDLLGHGLPALAWRLLNACLEASGDYEGLAVLRFYLVYRAMVRAKVALLRADAAAFGSHLALAASLAVPGRAALLAMHGLSGSGKTTVAQALLERIGAVRLRSDVERKRLHGLPASARSASAPDAGLYDAASGERTYARLADLAAAALRPGYPVIVDAAFLRRDERHRFRALAARFGVEFLIVSCEAADAVLRERIALRAAQASDASEAEIPVLERQLALHHPLTSDEAAATICADTGTEAGLRQGVEAVASRLAQRKAEALAPTAGARNQKHGHGAVTHH